MTQKKKKDLIDTEETFKQGLGGGILGAFVGMPGLGMTAGMLHANKDSLFNLDKKIYNSRKKTKSTTLF